MLASRLKSVEMTKLMYSSKPYISWCTVWEVVQYVLESSGGSDG